MELEIQDQPLKKEKKNLSVEKKIPNNWIPKRI